MRLEVLKKYSNLVLMIIIVLMGIEILYLVRQNQRLTAMVRDPKQVFQTLHAGETVPAIRTADLEGKDINLRYGPDQPYTVLFWFSPTCASCEDNFGFWTEIYSRYTPERIRFLGICAGQPEEARGMVESFDLPFSVICATDQFMVATYKGNVLPQTVIIEPVGSIKGVWPGALLERQQAEILAALDQIN